MTTSKTHYAELLPWEFEEKIREFPVAYLPLGTLEYHGRHLPLGADGIQAEGLFTKLSTEIGGIVLPMLFLGPDFRHKVDPKKLVHFYGMDVGSIHRDGVLTDYPDQQLPGSAYFIPEDDFVTLLENILTQLKRAGFKVVAAHGHGPSARVFSTHASLFRQNIGIDCIDCLTSINGEPLPFQNDHAGANETSITMAVRPDLVQIDTYPHDPADKPIAIIGKDPRFFSSVEYGQECLRQTADAVKQKIFHALDQIKG